MPHIMNFTDTDGGNVATGNEMLEPEVTTVPSNQSGNGATLSGKISLFLHPHFDLPVLAPFARLNGFD
jgi:hypothetical protein